MRFSTIFALLLPATLFAQAPPLLQAPISETTVVGTSDGQNVTVGDISKIVATIPPQMRANYSKDPKGFLSQWFMLKRLVAEAEKQKLADRTPYKENIEVARMQIMWNAMIEETSKTTLVSVDEEKKYYEQKKDDFTQAKLKLIYVPFVTAQAQAAPGSAKTMTEQQALAKSEDLVKKAREGGNFVEMVKQHSEDPISKEKGGDFGPVKRGDQLPDSIKQAVFKLKPGEISDPVRQPNGYYIFRLEELTPQAFEEVRTPIQTEVKNAKMKQWMETYSKATEMKVARQDFFDQIKQQ